MLMCKFNEKVLNTVHLAVSFFVLYSCQFNLTTIEKLINFSISQDNPNYHVDGFITSGIGNLTVSIFLLACPMIISLIGSRISMVLGCIMMQLYIYLFSIEIASITYLATVMAGIGGSLLWVGQGNYIVRNSGSDSVSMHVALFWSIFTFSKICGNLYMTFVFAGKNRIDYDMRQDFLHIITAIGSISVLLLVFLRPPKGCNMITITPKQTSLAALKKTFDIYFSKDFLTLLMTFIFIGFQQSFGYGVYFAAIGFTNSFGNFAMQLVPISAIGYGIGETFGAGLHIFAPKLGFHWTRRYVFWIAYFIHALSLVGIFLNIPNSAVFGYTDESSYLETPLVWLTILCSVSLGIGEGNFMTQILSLLAIMHPEHSSQTTALFKFTKNLAVAVFYFASTCIGMHMQILLILLAGLLGSICYSIVDTSVDTRLCEKHTENPVT